MKALDYSPNLRWLFCFAHPDDELAVAAFMRRLVQSGAEVHALWFHATEIRKREAIAAGAKIGLRQPAQFLGGNDGCFVDQLPELMDAASKVLSTIKPDRVVCAAFEQGHLDHDAANFIVTRLFGGPLIEFPEYWPYTPRVRAMNRFANPMGEEILSLNHDEQAWKRSLAAEYPSQGIRGYIGWYELWTRLKLSPARLILTERLRVQGEICYTQPIHVGAMRQRVLRSREWARWVAAIQKLGG